MSCTCDVSAACARTLLTVCVNARIVLLLLQSLQAAVTLTTLLSGAAAAAAAAEGADTVGDHDNVRHYS